MKAVRSVICGGAAQTVVRSDGTVGVVDATGGEGITVMIAVTVDVGAGTVTVTGGAVTLTVAVRTGGRIADSDGRAIGNGDKVNKRGPMVTNACPADEAGLAML